MSQNRAVFVCLYIPIWLYSNLFAWVKAHAVTNFTFQSGYIPTLAYNTLFFLKFTLHSNLVIFQPIASIQVIRLTIIFTFQSGYIPTHSHFTPCGSV